MSRTYEAFTTPDLSEYRIVNLFVGGIAERLRSGQGMRSWFVASWGIGEEAGELPDCTVAASKEDTETIRAFFQDVRELSA